MAASLAAMTALMAPRSVAIVGATERADASSSFVMRNLMAQGFAGSILPVNPKGGTVFGYPAATSLAFLGEVPDVAVIGIAADRVNAALREAAEAGVKAAVVLASGFAELDEEGRQRQANRVATATQYGMAVCGPNCLGLFNLHRGAALYSSTLPRTMKRGPLALVSHSGASAIALGNTGRIGLSHIVSSGNSAATDLPDYIGWLAQDDATKVIGIVVEAIRDPQPFTVAMEAVHAAGKTVIALRAGRSAGGQRATAAHTGALAGSNEAYASFFRRTGVVEVDVMDGFVETATLFCGVKARPSRKGVAVIGVSGGGVAHVADMADEAGIELPTFAPETVATLKTLLPPFASPQNPLDTTGVVFADASIYRRVLETVAADPSVGVIVAAQDAPPGLDEVTAAEYVGIAGAVAGFAGTTSLPTVLMSNLSAGHHPAVRAAAEGAVVLNGTCASLSAVRALLEPPARCGLRQARSHAADPRWTTMLGGGQGLTERDAKAFLAANGMAVTREALATSAEAAAEAARSIGFPVVMKIESPDLPHKTEAGGVRLGIGSEEGARAAFEEIMRNARAFAPEARLHGVVVQEMVSGGVEALLGLARHEPFGLGMVVGVGGVLVELVADAAFELLPIDRALALDMIARTKLGPLLSGFRGAPPADVEALAATMVALSDLASAYGDRIEAIDLNPVAVLPLGKGVRILDALVIPRA
ncbi:acetate--CoA ligase family protein [Mesorhizobium sp. IMUNJ 23232]|uniref:acetate--CoA ligase family protein n=1 Tax=Mesorhizobium sp. IMUNJ 23232 TaxID=3376064 RepID=UPI0037AEC805